MKLVKRLASLFTAVVILVSIIGLPNRATSVGETFPQFNPAEQSEITVESQLNWNPTKEWIFPTVIKASDYIANPLATYYLYASPHDAPGGIALFYSDSLDGDWTEYATNPRISNVTAQYSVLHVSSPHVIWVPEEQRFFMYFHGDNDITRYSTSADGINWTYGGVAIDAKATKMWSASYARVFRYTIPRLGNKYVMLYHEQYPFTDPAKELIRIRLATSDNARQWTLQPEVLITPSGIEGRRISSPTYFPWDGKHYVMYHSSAGDIHVTEVGANFDKENHLGVFYDSTANFPDYGRSAAPTFYTENNEMHMFYESGPRSNHQASTGPRSTIRHIKTSLTNLGQVVRPHSGDKTIGYFDDVTHTSHIYDIYKLERSGITTGCGTPLKFCPNDTITRAQLATFISRALKLPPRSNLYSSFSDVATQTSYTGHIEAIRAAGISNGCGNNNFCPNRLVTRQEMAVFMARALGLPPIAGNHFTDVAQGTSYTGYIYAISAAGITTGCGNATKYCPNDLVSRMQMASFMARGFNLK